MFSILCCNVLCFQIVLWCAMCSMLWCDVLCFLCCAVMCYVFKLCCEVLCFLCRVVMCYVFYVVPLCALLCCDLPLRVTTSARTTNEDSVILVLYGHCWEGSDITCQKRTGKTSNTWNNGYILLMTEFMKTNNNSLIGNAYSILAKDLLTKTFFLLWPQMNDLHVGLELKNIIRSLNLYSKNIIRPNVCYLSVKCWLLFKSHYWNSYTFNQLHIKGVI